MITVSHLTILEDFFRARIIIDLTFFTFEWKFCHFFQHTQIILRLPILAHLCFVAFINYQVYSLQQGVVAIGQLSFCYHL